MATLNPARSTVKITHYTCLRINIGSLKKTKGPVSLKTKLTQLGISYLKFC